MALTPEELERKFEQDRDFSEEPPEQTHGRLIWLTAMQRGEFALYLHGLGLEPDTLAAVLGGFAEMQRDYIDFVLVGLNQEYDAEREQHPNEAVFIQEARRLLGHDDGQTVEGYSYFADYFEGGEAMHTLTDIAQLSDGDMLEGLSILPSPEVAEE